MAGLKKFNSFAAAILAFSFAFGCSSGPQPESAAYDVLHGEHQLRKMVERTDLNSKISGGFFLLFGDLHGESKTSLNVKFAWQMNDGTWSISSLPIEKFRVKFDESKKAPTIKFRWLRWEYHGGNPRTQELMNRYVVYALITCREADWPVNIQLPLNK